MGRDEAMEARLQRWAQWVTVGDGSGYPSVCVLHENWSPPAAGQRPMMKVAAMGDERATHRAIGRLGIKLRNAVVVRYIYKGTTDEQALMMDCQAETVRGRIGRAHAALQIDLCNNSDMG